MPSRLPTHEVTHTTVTTPSRTGTPAAKPVGKPTGTQIPTSSFQPSTRKPTFRSASRIPTTNPTIAAKQDIVYHGGELMLGPVNLYNIYIGDFTTSAKQRKTSALVDYFAANFGRSSLYNVMTSYYQVINGNKVYVSNSLNFVKSIAVHPYAMQLNITTMDIIHTIVDAINQNQLPFDLNGIYAVIFRGNFNFNGYLKTWCGSHSFFIPLNTNYKLKFFVVGDPETAPESLQSNCAELPDGTVNDSLGGDSIANIYAHEVMEIVTNTKKGWSFDGDVIPGNNLIYRGSENADACNWVFLSANKSNMMIGNKSFLIQSVWQPKYGCVLAKV